MDVKWSSEITGSSLIKLFPKAIYHVCSPTDTIVSVFAMYGVRVHYNRDSLLYSYQV